MATAAAAKAPDEGEVQATRTQREGGAAGSLGSYSQSAKEDCL